MTETPANTRGKAMHDCNQSMSLDELLPHDAKLIMGAFLMSGVTAGVTYSQRQGQNNYNTTDAGNAMSEALGQQSGQVTARVGKNPGIGPAPEIRPGYRFNAWSSRI
ncbi:MAG: hypothetical protein LBI59_12445 [Candidatus Accumulibacter sp.]|nr:hypothetical protein [Accumulibacter sp.]